MTKYTIERPEEETECEQCGWPLLVGETAYETDTGRIACSVDHGRAVDARRRNR